MKARIHVLTLAVADLERALAFYRDGLGLQSDGIVGKEFVGTENEPAGAVAMVTLDDGLILSLYPRLELAKDANVTSAQLSIGHVVDTRDEVESVLAAAKRAGATVAGPAHERPWGIYSGYFSDPDGHLWEVVHFTAKPADAVRTVTRAVEADADPADVVTLLADATRIPEWAPDFAGAVVPDGPGQWRATRDGEDFAIRTVVEDTVGTVDYLCEAAPGRLGSAYLRALPRPGGGTVVTMTLALASNGDRVPVLRDELAALARLTATGHRSDG